MLYENTQNVPYLIDSHCHLNQLDLTGFNGNLDNVLHYAREQGVMGCLCVSITPEDVSVLYGIADQHTEVSISVGVHPNEGLLAPVSSEALLAWAAHPACVAIGETGLDYYRVHDVLAQELQREQFRQHIRAARQCNKPLIIHTREAAEDTLRIMHEERASEVGGVMHCFVESFEVAQRALDLNFYISFSGIITFKNATAVQAVAKKIPSDRLLIETDSPYLAPMPFRGTSNHPGLLPYVAQTLGALRNESTTAIADATTRNFYRCFSQVKTPEWLKD